MQDRVTVLNGILRRLIELYGDRASPTVLSNAALALYKDAIESKHIEYVPMYVSMEFEHILGIQCADSKINEIWECLVGYMEGAEYAKLLADYYLAESDKTVPANTALPKALLTKFSVYLFDGEKKSITDKARAVLGDEKLNGWNYK